MFYCPVCGRESKNKSIIDNCKHTRVKKSFLNIEPKIEEENKKNEIIILEDMVSKSINKVYHCSDIHIRLNSQHDQYRDVFNNFYTMLRESELGIIVCCGDILHNKNELSPECIVLVLDFLENLAKIMPTFIIAGNHDAVLCNSDKMDSLSGILNRHSIPDLYYLKNSGVYRYNNIVFGVSSLLDSNFIYSDTIQKKPDDILIGLYHGSVGSPINDLGYKISGEKYIDEFKGYDIVMLGDIHKFQYLNESKTIAYCSSLISQNFGECDEYHGYLEWDIMTKQSLYRIVQNESRYIRIVYDNQTHIDIPKKCNLQVSLSSFNEKNNNKYLENLVLFKKHIKEKYPNVRVNYVYIDSIQAQSVSNKLENLSENLLTYITKRYPNISSIDSEWLMKNIDCSSISSKSNNIHWSVLYMKWDYMYKYGGNNTVDFRKLSSKAINGLIAPNSSGKSTFIDIITFLLFSVMNRDISNRFHLQPDIINKNVDKCNGVIYFSTNENDIYMIEKSVSRKKDKGINLICNFYKLIEDINGKYEWDGRTFNKECLNGKDRKETDKFISEIIGTYDDFVFHSLCLQFDNKSFRTMPPKERKEFMYRLFNLDFLTRQHPNANDNLKKIKNTVDTLKKSLELFDVNGLKLKKQTIYNELKFLNELENDTNKERIILNEQRDELYKRLYPIEKSISSCDNDANLNKLNCLETLINDKHEYKYIIFRDQITLENTAFLKERDMKCEKILEKIMECNRLKQNIVSIHDFDKKRLIDLSKKIYPENLKDRISELRIKLNNVVDTLKPVHTQDKCNQLIFAIDKSINKINLTKNIIEYDNSVLERYNNYLNNISINNRIKSSIEILENSINRLENDYKYNPECNICMNNPQTIQLFNMRKEITELNNSLIRLEDNNIILEYEEYSILKTNYDLEERRIEKALKCLNDLREQKFELCQELILINKYEEYQSKEKYREEYEMLIKLDKEYEEYLALKKLDKCEMENKIIIENNNVLDKEILKLKEERQLLLSSSYYKYVELLNELEEFNNINTKIEMAKIEKTNLIKDIELYKNILINSKIYHEIDIINSKIKLLDNNGTIKICQLEREYGEIEGRLLSYENTMIQLSESYVEMRRYEYLEGVLSVKGFSLYLLENNLVNISNGVSEILTPLIGLSVKLCIENNDIIMYIYKLGSNKESKLDTFGGMEQFMIDFSFRVLSLRYTMLPRSDLFILDETFSCFDTENLGKVNIIYDLLYSLYEHIIVITHLDTLKDSIHNKINIINNGEFAMMKI
jgi:DNA repair exonuclease SbcCD ATPase subunit